MIHKHNGSSPMPEESDTRPENLLALSAQDYAELLDLRREVRERSGGFVDGMQNVPADAGHMKPDQFLRETGSAWSSLLGGRA